MARKKTERMLIEILRILSNSTDPLGARAIAEELMKRGYDVTERAVRYHLASLDSATLTVKHGNYGRSITSFGLKELEDALVEDRLGFTITRIEELIYNTVFNLEEGGGMVIGDVLIVDKGLFDRAVGIIKEVIQAGYAVSNRVKILEEGAGGSIVIPFGRVGIATICSMTVDGALIRSGIPVDMKYSGTLQILGSSPTAFTDLIGYSGTSMNPTEIFISRGMTSILSAARTGSGKILANYREIPSAAVDDAKRIIENMAGIGIDGTIKISEEENLGIRVSGRHAGITMCTGINMIAAVLEDNSSAEIYAMGAAINYNEMREIDKI